MWTSLWQTPADSTRTRTCSPVGVGVGYSRGSSALPHWMICIARMARLLAFGLRCAADRSIPSPRLPARPLRDYRGPALLRRLTVGEPLHFADRCLGVALLQHLLGPARLDRLGAQGPNVDAPDRVEERGGTLDQRAGFRCERVVQLATHRPATRGRPGRAGQ